MAVDADAVAVELEAVDGFTEAVVELRVDDSVALGTEQGADQGVDDGVAVDVERTVCLDNILARCCGATAGTALQGDGVFFPREHVCVPF